MFTSSLQLSDIPWRWCGRMWQLQASFVAWSFLIAFKRIDHETEMFYSRVHAMMHVWDHCWPAHTVNMTDHDRSWLISALRYAMIVAWSRLACGCGYQLSMALTWLTGRTCIWWMRQACSRRAQAQNTNTRTTLLSAHLEVIPIPRVLVLPQNLHGDQRQVWRFASFTCSTPSSRACLQNGSHMPYCHTLVLLLALSCMVESFA